MSTELPEGWTVDEEPKDQLPAGWTVEEPKQNNDWIDKVTGDKPYRDIVSENLRAQGVEPDFTEELERATAFGMIDAYKGIASGATFGLTENIPGLKNEGDAAFKIGQVAGELIPLSKMLKLAGSGATKLASKSPVFQKQLSSLLNILGVGATGAAFEASKSLAKGELPTQDDVLEHGVEWAALDTALQFVGAGGKFLVGLARKAKQLALPELKVVNETINELRSAGVDFKNPEIVGAKALEIINQEVPIAEQVTRQLELAKKQKPIADELAQTVFKQEAITPSDLKTKDIKPQINNLGKESVFLSEPYQPSARALLKEAEALEDTVMQSKIDSIGPRAATEQELGIGIRDDIEAQLVKDKEAYAPLYKTAEEAADVSIHIPENTAREAGKKLISLNRVKTRPEGYNAVIRNLENVLEDAGFKIQRQGNKNKGLIESIISEKPVPVEKTMELARRLNEIIDYEAVEPTVKNALKSVAKAAKQDIRIGLASNPDALAAFELAEAEHARVAKKFGNESISKIRGTKQGERIAALTNTPSGLGELRDVLTPNQMKQVEREVIEKINSQGYERAKKQLKEIEKHLSEENRKIARDLVEAKNPHNPSVRKKLLQEAILEDVSNALTAGSRPEKTLKLWKTPKGQKLVKESFDGSSNWAEIKTYLEKQSFNDMISSVLKDGKIDVKKLKSFMQDPGTVNNIRMAGGDEAVNFFRNMDTQLKQLESNAKLLERFPSKSEAKRGKDLLSKTKAINQKKPVVSKIGEEKIGQSVRIKKESTNAKGKQILDRMARQDYPIQKKLADWKDWIKETLGLNAQAAMTVFGVAKLGGAAAGATTFGVPTTVATMLGYRMMNKLLTSPRARKAFLEATKTQTNPIAFLLALEEFGEEFEN